MVRFFFCKGQKFCSLSSPYDLQAHYTDVYGLEIRLATKSPNNVPEPNTQLPKSTLKKKKKFGQGLTTIKEHEWHS